MQQQNQSNRERVLDNTGWPGAMLAETKGEGAQVSGEFGNAEGSNVEGSADPNYMYGSQPGHNGTATGEGY